MIMKRGNMRALEAADISLLKQYIESTYMLPCVLDTVGLEVVAKIDQFKNEIDDFDDSSAVLPMYLMNLNDVDFYINKNKTILKFASIHDAKKALGLDWGDFIELDPNILREPDSSLHNWFVNTYGDLEQYTHESWLYWNTNMYKDIKTASTCTYKSGRVLIITYYKDNVVVMSPTIELDG